MIIGGSRVLWQRNRPAKFCRSTGRKSRSRTLRSCTFFANKSHQARTCSVLSLHRSGCAGGDSRSTDRPKTFRQRHRGGGVLSKARARETTSRLRAVTLSFPSGSALADISSAQNFKPPRRQLLPVEQRGKIIEFQNAAIKKSAEALGSTLCRSYSLSIVIRQFSDTP
jgi:hypothetical protein